MKHAAVVVMALVMCASARAAGTGAKQPAKPADPRLRTVVFNPEAVVDVPVRRGLVTQIVLPDDELIVGQPATGKGSNCAEETHTWCIAIQGRDVFVKPKTGATANNLIVTTSRRRHVFALHPTESGVPLMRLTVALPPPPAPLVEPPAIPPMSSKELIDNRLQAKARVRNANYSVATGKDSDDLVPVMVFDDGTQTYFGFPNNRPLPSVFQTAPDGSEEMVNVRMDGDDLLVADRVARRFVLRLGNSVVSIINEDFDLDGVAPKAGTTIPGVARVLKAGAPGPTAQ